MNLISTNTTFEFVGQTKSITADCFAISFFRPTTSNPVSINGLPIEAGQTLTIEQNVGQIDRSHYDVVFGAGVNSNELHIIRIIPMSGYR